MGNSYRLLGNDAEAIKCYLKASALDTPFSDNTFGAYDNALGNLGLLEYTYGNDDAAIAYYTAALEKNPLHFDSIWNYANALLRKHCSLEDVDLASAWKMYEYRFKRSSATRIDTSIVRWDGSSSGRSIVVLAEQGMGDKFMFGRYIHCLRDYFAEIWVQCPKEMETIFSEYNTCQAIPDVECSIPICSLAGIFGSSDDAWLVGMFSARKFAGDKLKIGIEWAGSDTHSNNKYRSVASNHFLSLAEFGDLYSIRPEAEAVRGVTALNACSWAESAEIVNGLDLIISVDTSIVHLAGSLGKECWMLQPLKETDFRWGNNAMGEKNIWYDSVKVIRNHGNWSNVFAEVRARLELRRLEAWKDKMQSMIGDLNAQKY
jgi:tetratricopeptide (TPR) repeat protein